MYQSIDFEFGTLRGLVINRIRALGASSCRSVSKECLMACMIQTIGFKPGLASGKKRNMTRSIGFRRSLSVTFPVHNYRVKVSDDNKLANCAVNHLSCARAKSHSV